jgi:two-component system phosphate regulon sensor histidine kinase PhoR
MRSPDGASVCDTACPVLHSSGGGTVEVCLSTLTGEEVWSEISYGRVVDATGRLVGVVHILRDLTERKEVERLKDEFISMVSHELRTPLNHIKGFATTLLQTDVEWDAATQRDFLGSIDREADRLTDLVIKILHLSRLEVDGLPMEKEWYQIADLVDGALQRLHSLVADQHFDLHLAADLPALSVDGREIEVVLMNLIENAIKYSDPGTHIALRVECQDHQVVFSVADQGIGIPPEQIGRIFERFYRLEGAGRRKPGTGLGLAICKRIVEAHGGRIWVESTPGAGSCFYFSLPVNGAIEER